MVLWVRSSLARSPSLLAGSAAPASLVHNMCRRNSPGTCQGGELHVQYPDVTHSPNTTTNTPAHGREVSPLL
ncbi:hypothetical protein PF005_g9558 [Phytophthora fragariae]|uniref:Uncharacterized protein n=1 Tax=Phytophthora fragariae TaxID=53985 RepID=A0A6A3FIZ9_9STRA|nr:hypothetical protein PF003_g18408 [Phytophthora fragariae]KAE8944616.1 hypothetical protein PF009_g5713 [Phytophthora fragariae]KAE9120913.1 hypothetical protein PF007_g7995 [Phytophthora fragariae]KAE9142437.1 hypothetical protein PF006_g12448 [Phytophthora fragariae]KAE9215113.1 hypothetical protein PF005_g9558 [Phytophthora fragariae]